MAPTGEESFEEQVQLSSLHDIKSEGISIRVGNQIVKFVADETQDILVEDEVKNEMQEQFDAEYDRLKETYNVLVQSTKDQLRQRTRDLDKRENELSDMQKNLVQLPVLTETHTRQGLSVSRRDDSRGGYLWSYICVYAPKFINSKVIDPNFAKRLMTPIRIYVKADSNWKVTEVRFVKLINCDKFHHYHSMGGDSDCWGDWKYSGELVDTPEKALRFIRDIQAVLETINRLSIGQEAPRGLSRLSTVENHLLDERPDPQNDKRTGAAAKRNERAGFDENVNADATGDMWDATVDS